MPPRSAPAQKASSPAPVRTTTRTSGSSSGGHQARRADPAMASQDMALRRSGRLMVIRVVPELCSVRTTADRRMVTGRARWHGSSVATGGRLVAGTVAIVSFRLGGSDGVSVEAAKWAGAFGSLGLAVVTVAGSGPADHLLPGLAIGAPSPPTARSCRRPWPVPMWWWSRTCVRCPSTRAAARRGRGAAGPSGGASSPRPALAAAAVHRPPSAPR